MLSLYSVDDGEETAKEIIQTESSTQENYRREESDNGPNLKMMWFEK